MLKNYFILMVCVLCFGSCYAGEWTLVNEGVPEEECTFFSTSAPREWSSENGALVNSGMYRFLATRHRFSPHGLRGEAVLSIDRFNHTAASFTIGQNQFLFDAQSEEFYVEGSDLYQELGNDFEKVKLEDGKPFRFSFTLDKGKASFYINGKKIGSCHWTYDRPVGLALRPHRAVMRVYDFRIAGDMAEPSELEDFLGIRTTRPVLTAPLSIAEDVEVKVFSFGDFEFGKKQGTLVSLDSSESVACEVELSGITEPTVKISSAYLSKAYNNSKCLFDLKPFRLVIRNDKGILADQVIGLFDPQKKGNFPKSEVRSVGGMPDIFVNDKSNGMMLGLVSRKAASHVFTGDSVRQFAEAGFDIFPMYVSPYVFMQSNGKLKKEAFMKDFEAYMMRFIGEASNGRVLLRWRLFMPPGWCDVYPEEAIKLDNGVTTLSNTPFGKLQPSYASLLWRKHAGEVMKELLQEFRNSPYADRIIGVQLCHGNCGEWNHWGYQQQAFVDFSVPMQNAFGSWLKEKYKTENVLREKWGNPAASFSAPVPDRALRLNESNSLLRRLPKGQAAADYYRFFSDLTVDDIEYFARIIKVSSNRRLLTGAFYGYYIRHIAGGSYHFQDSGHYASQKFVESEDLDFIAACHPYFNMLDNLVLNGASASAALHGKMWLNENDQRTHRSGKINKPYGTTHSLEESIAVLWRGFIQNLGKQSSYYFFDFFQGWYSDPEFMKELTRLRKLDRFAEKAGRQSHAQVAVFVNEKGIPYMSNLPAARMRDQFLMYTQEINAVGAPWQMFLLSDLENVDLSQYKLLIFPDSYCLDAEDIKAIKTRAQGGGRTLLWLYAPGMLSLEKSALDTELSRELTGMEIRYREKTAFKQLIPDTAKIKKPLVSESSGPGFMTYIADKQAKVFGHLDVDNLPGAASKNMGDWKSVVVCFPGLNRYWLREIYRQAGVHLWVRKTYPVFHTAGPFVGIYTRKRGRHLIELPRKVEIVYDLVNNCKVAQNTRKIVVTVSGNTETNLFYVGEADLLAGNK